MVLTSLLSEWQRWTCSHQWVRARWDDGSYGMRCAACMKPYPHTWNEIIEQAPAGRVPTPATLSATPAPLPAAALTAAPAHVRALSALPAAPLADLPPLRRAA